MTSPYEGIDADSYREITEELVNKHPLNTQELAEICLSSWDEILQTQIGGKDGLAIGVDIFPKPQIMAFFLHELIPHTLQKRYPDTWKPEATAHDKDIVHIPDEQYSIEIKTSSSPKNIFGNRSYAQDPETSKKKKTGYYLAVNFEKFSKKTTRPEILLIRFGWIDHGDWMGQKAATGQQARLSPETEKGKLLVIYAAD